MLLGLVIEKVTGNKLEQEIATRITTPLGLPHTLLPANAAQNVTTTQGYNPRSRQRHVPGLPKRGPVVLVGAGAMISNLPDLKVWAEALAQAR